jgi:hypothetical protein
VYHIDQFILSMVVYFFSEEFYSVLFRFVQNLVFYGISQSTGSWGFDPYCKYFTIGSYHFFSNITYVVSFTISACVEIMSYIVLHLVLNRIGRKLPYFVAVLCFALIALMTIPVQSLMLKNSQSILKFVIVR